MPEAQDKVLEAIKSGCSTRKEIIAFTGFALEKVDRAIFRLRNWRLIESDYHGKYWV